MATAEKSRDSEMVEVTETKAPPRIAALLAEFDDVTVLARAARAVRDAGYERWDVHSPCPIHGMDAAMGIKPTKLPFICLLGGVSGTFLGLFMVWYTNAHDYPFLISGKPLFSLPANIPVIFETTVLLAAFGAVFGMLALNRLPWLSSPLFTSERFRRASDDRFFIVIDAFDAKFDRQQTEQMLRDLGALEVEQVNDVPHRYPNDPEPEGHDAE